MNKVTLYGKSKTGKIKEWSIFVDKVDGYILVPVPPLNIIAFLVTQTQSLSCEFSLFCIYPQFIF